MQLSDFDYELPKELIAQEPVRPRSDSRLMIVDGENIEHKLFLDILNYFKKGDVLVINETKVMKVRLVGKKLTGSEVQLIITGKKSEGVYICRIATRTLMLDVF